MTNFLFLIIGCFSSGEKKNNTNNGGKKETFLDEADRGRIVIPVKDFDQFCPNCSLRDSLYLTTHC